MKRIFFVEDDLSLINGLSFAIKKQGYEIDIVRTVLEAHKIWQDGKYDLVILDVSLPDGNGYDLCREIRKTSKVPIIFLTAADEETDIIMGLDIGGDDYITKPFKLAILLSRINALLRRSENFSQQNTELCSNGIKVELLKSGVYKDGIPMGCYYHIESVAKNAELLAEKYGADKEVVIIAAWLHDIASITDYSMYEEHHVYGATIAKEILNELNYEDEKTELVQKCVFNHRGSVNLEKLSKEELCVVDADAISHFDSVPSLLYLAYVERKMNIEEGV